MMRHWREVGSLAFMNTVQSPLRQITGAVLAGGLSSRMGRPKHDLQLPDGRTMLEATIAVVGQVCHEVVVVAPEVVIDNVRHVHDPEAGCGPLAGVIALLESDLSEQYLVVPCDMPGLTSKLLLDLCCPIPLGARVFQIDSAEQLSPLPLAISVNARSQLHNAQEQGIRSMHGALAQTELDIYRLPDSDEPYLYNINSPEDLERLNH